MDFWTVENACDVFYALFAELKLAKGSTKAYGCYRPGVL